MGRHIGRLLGKTTADYASSNIFRRKADKKQASMGRLAGRRIGRRRGRRIGRRRGRHDLRIGRHIGRTDRSIGRHIGRQDLSIGRHIGRLNRSMGRHIGRLPRKAKKLRSRGAARPSPEGGYAARGGAAKTA